MSAASSQANFAYVDLSALGEGQELPPLVKDPITLTQLVRYAGASGDFNPLHYDENIGKLAGTGGVIAHGMLIMGFAGQALTRWFPNRCLKKFKVRFVGMTRLGDRITVQGRVKKIDRDAGRAVIEISAADHKGEVKLNGTAEIALTAE